MRQDTGNGLRSIDRIVAQMPNFEGVYGPLYRLFEITDDKFKELVQVRADLNLACCRHSPYTLR